MINYGTPSLYLSDSNYNSSSYPCSSAVTPTLYEVQMLGKQQAGTQLIPTSFPAMTSNRGASNGNGQLMQFFMQLISILLDQLPDTNTQKTPTEEIITVS